MSSLGFDFPAGVFLPPDPSLPPDLSLPPQSQSDPNLHHLASSMRPQPLLIEKTSSGSTTPSGNEYSPSGASPEFFFGRDLSSSSDERRGRFNTPDFPQRHLYRTRRPSSLGPNGSHGLPSPSAEGPTTTLAGISSEEYVRRLEFECQQWKSAYLHTKYVIHILSVIEL